MVDGPVGLGHRRLAIIDLSSAASQPMGNESGELIIVYNGELFNFRQLRLQLEGAGHRFHSNSDTEVVIHGYEQWGEGCLDRFNGQFALAIWDTRRRQVFLARDRYGVKPLYYYHDSERLIFASEIKAILEHPAVAARLSYPALGEYLTFQNIFTNLTLFDGVKLLQPGCTLCLTPGSDDPVRWRRYWDYEFRPDPGLTSAEECSEELYRLFEQAVGRQLVSDVPVGSYLSGGMDSGSITAIAARQIPRIHTFTGGFDLSSASGLELSFDERAASEEMANLFKTEHYEVVLHAGDMEHVLPELVWHLEDLRVGQSYPNYYAARLAGKFVKVVLSGAGGDELFGGYPWRYYRALATNGSESYYQAYYDYWQRLVPDEDRALLFNDATNSKMNDSSPFDAFRRVFPEEGLPLEGPEDIVNASLYFECKTFLHGLFVVEDKLSMAHSLETRVPFLDNDLVDFAMKIPPRFKLRDLLSAPELDENEIGRRQKYRAEPTADGKVVLRNAMERLVPESVTARQKQGFSAPDASWFRGESIDYVNGLLRDPRAEIYEFLNTTYVGRRLDEHTSGRHNHRLFIWSLLSLEWWLRTFLAGKPALG